MPPGGWPICWPSAATWTRPRTARPGRRRRRGSPPCGWPSCWPSAATWTGRQILRARADAGDETAAVRWPVCWPQRGDLDGLRTPGPTPATGSPPAAGRAAGRARRPGRGLQRPGRRRRRVRRLAAGRAAGRARRPGRAVCAPGPTPATGLPPGGWPTCWPSAVTWTGCAPGPTPATACRRAAGRAAGRARRPGRAARPGRRRRPGCRPELAELLAERGDLDGPQICAPGPTPATRTSRGRLAELLIKQGRGEEAERLRRFGLNPDGSIAGS